MRRSVILDQVLDTVFRTGLVFSLFLLFAGHNAPGGGFIGGLVAGAVLVLRYVAGGADEVGQVFGIAPEAVLGTGLVVAVGTGLAGWWWAGDFMETARVEWEVPVLGLVKASSALIFDIGVYLVVVGLALGVLLSLGREADR